MFALICSENFKADFLKMASAIPASTFFWVETWFKYQNNEQDLEIWDMQIAKIAKF